MDLYTIYHLNLGYSSIPEDQYPQVIERCYWPLLEWAEKDLARFGIEMPSATAQIINKIDPRWIEKFKTLQTEKKVELVASGLIQAIFPLIPVEINRWNLKEGLQGYEKLFACKPHIAYLHEQTFSKSLVGIYKEANFKGIVFDWSNASQYTSNKQTLAFKCPLVLGMNQQKLQVLWNNSVAFQYMQRYIHEDLEIHEYFSFLEMQRTINPSGAFCFYGSDIEILDYRPGSADAYYGLGKEQKEKSRFVAILEHIKNSDKFRWLLPSEVLEQHSTTEEIYLETSDCPIPTKKQDTYNVTRWAVGGRQNPKLNTLCYRAYHLLKENQKQIPAETLPELWTKLSLAWGSDYRTYTTEEKYLESQIQIGGLLQQLEKYSKSIKIAENKVSSTSIKGNISKNLLSISSKNCELHLNIKRGTIKELCFGNKAVIGTVAQGTYSNISHAVDYYSGHAIAERPGAFRYTDRENTVLVSHGETDNGYSAIFKHTSPMLILWKTYTVFKEDSKINIRYHFHFKDLPTARIRLGILTALPQAFEKNSLWYATHNGGENLEYFSLKDSPAFDAGDPLGFVVSSSFCLGATQGIMQFGDRHRGIQIETDKSEQYSVPLIAYTPFADTFMLRLSHSIGEWDDTANTLWRGHTKINLSITPITGQLPSNHLKQGSV